MSSFEVWAVEEASGRDAWLDRWNQWEEREPAAHPAFAPLFASADQLVRCAFYSGPAGQALFPFLLRPLKSEPWGRADDGWDATSPYGYGGPFVVSGSASSLLASGFWSAFEDWARAQPLVSLFGRLSLFDDQRLSWPEGSGQILFGNIVRDLRLEADVLWMDYDRKVRKNVKRARREGLRFEVDREGARLPDFLGIYSETMNRNEASSGYYFESPFFETLLHEIPGGAVLFHVRQGEKIVSTEIALTSRSRIYSFLGGTLREAFPARANDFLKHEMIVWGMENGFSEYVLGGGYGGEDGIFRYKRSFAPHGVLPFSVGRLILDAGRSDALLARRRSHSTDSWEPRDNFFPPYRSP